MRRKIEQELTDFYHNVPPVERGQKEALLAQFKHKTLALPRETSLLWFIRTQARFVDRHLLALQFALLILYAVFLTEFHIEEGLKLLVPAVPLVALIVVIEVARSFRWGMAEMELYTRFSLAHILLARLTITAMAGALSFIVMLALTALQTSATPGLLILYGLTPGFLAAGGGLFLVNRCQGTAIQYYLSAYCIALAVLSAATVQNRPQWYDGTAAAVWLAVLAAAAAVFSLELRRMLKNCSQGLEPIEHGGVFTWN